MWQSTKNSISDATEFIDQDIEIFPLSVLDKYKGLIKYHNSPENFNV